MGFRWKVRLFGKDWIEIKDWARDVLDYVDDLIQIRQFKFINNDKEVSVYLDSGVIFIEENVIHLGVNLGGYGYKLSESVIELIKIAPFTSAVYNITNKNSKVLEFQKIIEEECELLGFDKEYVKEEAENI